MLLIDSLTGVISFNSAPNFEIPEDVLSAWRALGTANMDEYNAWTKRTENATEFKRQIAGLDQAVLESKIQEANQIPR